jgi:hypothetical protein
MKPTAENIIEQLSDLLNNPEPNIAQSERMISTGAGAFVLYTGVTKIFQSPLTALAEISIGGLLLYRGVSGHCPIKKRLSPEPNKEVTIIEHRIVEPHL